MTHGIQQAKSDLTALRILADPSSAIENTEGRQARFVFHRQDYKIDSQSFLKILKSSSVLKSPAEIRFSYDSSSKQLISLVKSRRMPPGA